MNSKLKKWEISEEGFEKQYQKAVQRGKREMAKGAYAISARYDKVTKRIVVDLANGATLLVPSRLIEGLQQASGAELAKIDILGAGTGLYWPSLDVDIGVTGLLKGVFGTRAWMAEMGRAGGQSTSEAKSAASRANGRLGGRPKKAGSETRRRKTRQVA